MNNTFFTFYLGPLIRSKAKEIAESLGNNTFNASSGWLNKFKIRHNITFKAICGEAASVNPEDVAAFMVKLPSLIKGYLPKDIYNADETGLYFRALPNKTMTLKNQKCVGGKLSKERITILHCANMAGEKEKLLAIGKASKPRAFKNLVKENLPVTWKSNTKSWMTSEIMSEWLENFDRKMGAQNRKILLFLDNAASHPKHSNLKNIKIHFLHPNCTSISQPLDQGVIKNFKHNYRTLILKHLLANIEISNTAHDLVKRINVLDAVYFAKSAWDQVTAETVQNCFRKAGFTFDSQECPTSFEVDFEPEDELPLNLLAEIQRRCFSAISEQSLNDFYHVDDYLPVERSPLDLRVPLQEQISEVQEISDESTEEIEPLDLQNAKNNILTYKEALAKAHDLIAFVKFQGDTEAMNLLSSLDLHFQDIIAKTKTRQTRMEEYLLK